MITLATTHESFLFPTPAINDSEIAIKTAQRNAKLLEGKQKLTSTEDVTIPPWLPDTPAVREELTTLYDNVSFTEKKLAILLSDLTIAGVDNNTIVIVTTDHGDGLPRAKRSIYDSGIRVPLMIRFPGETPHSKIRSG